MPTLHLRSQSLIYTPEGHRDWQVNEEIEVLTPQEIGIGVIDMWDKHWSTGATRRCAALALPMQDVLQAARAQGMHIVHAPSGTISFYHQHPAYQRGLAQKRIEPSPVPSLPRFPSPVDAHGGGSDTEDEYGQNTGVWTRQTSRLGIDEEKDLISEDGDVIYSFLAQRGVKRTVIMGVHTNMCILNRPFGIHALHDKGMPVALCRDLTDCMYDPQKAPYVSHAEGTRLVVESIEKLYAPTILSADLLPAPIA
jgi:nicotinamidase-related amidase